MGKIHQLPEHIIAQIAAGEVIERPAYAIKELIENSIDAKAETIQIDLEDGGIKKIIVTDDGEGMTKEDLLISYKHHTTSKLTTQLNTIKSLGFRGEALSSIAAISTLKIKSRTAEELAGTQIVLNEGKLQSNHSIGMPKGTQVIVENIFSSIPARKKFLKSSRTELRFITNMVLQAALANPLIAFRLANNKRIIIDFRKKDKYEERIKALIGSDIFDDSIPIEYENNHIQIRGRIVKPHIISSNTNKQFVIVNNRNVFDRVISQTVKEAYGRMLDASSYPLFIIYLNLPHEHIDVNVHPRKEEIAFMNYEKVLDAISQSVQNSLQKNNLTAFSFPWFQEKNNMPEYATNMLRDEASSWKSLQMMRVNTNSEVQQIHQLYLIIETFNGMMIIDQHAAHERILYEEFVHAFRQQKQKSETYTLPNAIILTLSSLEKDLVHEYKDKLSDNGFIVEDFGHDALKISHVPQFFKDHDIGPLLKDFLEAFVNDSFAESIDPQSEKMLAFLACRTAIKAGDKLTKKQASELIKKIEKTDNKYTCPHGRPTRIEIPLRTIHSSFKR